VAHSHLFAELLVARRNLHLAQKIDKFLVKRDLLVETVEMVEGDDSDLVEEKDELLEELVLANFILLALTDAMQLGPSLHRDLFEGLHPTVNPNQKGCFLV